MYNWSEKFVPQARNATAAAELLRIPHGIISIAQSKDINAASAIGQLPEGESAVLYRGRAAERLVAQAARQPWEHFNACLNEDLREPGRLHADPFVNLHICQGISLGYLFEKPLREICETYDPDSHPITGLLLDGGPAELLRWYELPHEES